eukprot:COSAG02_NODE_27114_length_616_cov_1.874275_1_plen_45_part_10
MISGSCKRGGMPPLHVVPVTIKNSYSGIDVCRLSTVLVARCIAPD